MDEGGRGRVSGVAKLRGRVSLGGSGGIDPKDLSSITFGQKKTFLIYFVKTTAKLRSIPR